MDNTSNKIATAAITVQPWHHIAEYTKYDSPFNAYDLQNLLQVRTFIRKWILASWHRWAPWGVYFILTANQSYQHLSDNAFIIKFHICISIWKGNEHWRRKIRAVGTTVINGPCDQAASRAEGVSHTTMRASAYKKRHHRPVRAFRKKMLSFKLRQCGGSLSSLIIHPVMLRERERETIPSQFVLNEWF